MSQYTPVYLPNNDVTSLQSMPLFSALRSNTSLPEEEEGIWNNQQIPTARPFYTPMMGRQRHLMRQFQPVWLGNTQNINMETNIQGMQQQPYQIPMQGGFPRANRKKSPSLHMTFPEDLSGMGIQVASAPNQIELSQGDSQVSGVPSLRRPANQSRQGPLKGQARIQKSEPIVLDISEHTYMGRIKFYDHRKKFGFI